MLDLKCPLCRFPYVRWLSETSSEAVNSYLCYGCGHVWDVPKSNSMAQPRQ